jgi:hypothetical protein
MTASEQYSQMIKKITQRLVEKTRKYNMTFPQILV